MTKPGIILSGLGLTFLSLQLVRPQLVNSPASADLPVPADVKAILGRSCYACHSNETRLSWFDEIVPAYWLVARDVKTARMHLNFSTVSGQSLLKQKAVLFESVSQIELGAMPPPSYILLHREAVIASDELAVLRDYLLLIKSKQVAQSDVEATDVQYREWIAAAAEPFAVHAAPNGIAFLPDYKNWKAISSTDRADTNTLKMILANDIAFKAVAANNINPWPDGTAFAKVSWRQQSDENGVVQTGRFEQVAFMIKDSKRYASTAGWGWAQWMGTELKPYGRNANFAGECVACHAPLRKNDYVFTAPIASLRGPG
jgi:hypothetical protein